MDLSENRILCLVNLKKKDGFKYLYKNYYPSLCKFSFRITNNYSESEDLVQDFFIRLWKIKVNFESEKALISYLYLSVRNASFNVVRDRAKRGEEEFTGLNSLEHLETSGPTIQQIMIEEEVSRLVYAAINKLTPERRNVMLLVLEGLSNHEIAQQIGISINTVKSLKLRTYRTLRRELEPVFSIFFL